MEEIRRSCNCIFGPDSCQALVHVDSNVTSTVSYMAPDLEMMHVADLLASNAPLRNHADEISAVRLPLRFVQRGYMAANPPTSLSEHWTPVPMRDLEGAPCTN